MNFDDPDTNQEIPVKPSSSKKPIMSPSDMDQRKQRMRDKMAAKRAGVKLPPIASAQKA